MKQRIHSLDTLKGIAIFFIIYIHSIPLLSSTGLAGELNFLLSNIARFAVPSFFMTSGYLLGKKLGDDNGKEFVYKQVRRLSKYYISASIAYLPISIAVNAVKNQVGGQLPDWPLHITGIEGLIQFIYLGRGIAPFLWFLPALIFSLLILQKAIVKDMENYILLVSSLLHLGAILGNIYTVFEIPFLVEDALLFGLFFTTVGFFVEKKNVSDIFSIKQLKIATVVFILLNLVERILINLAISFPNDISWTNPYFWGPYNLFLIPMVVSIFVLTLRMPDLGKNSRINLYGKHTLTAYLTHQIVIGIVAGLMIMIGFLTGIEINGTLIWNFALMPITYIVSMEISVKLKSIQ